MPSERDPVSGSEIDRDQAIRLDHGDHVHYFASEETRAAFLADPKRYHDAPAAGAAEGGGRLANPDDPPYTVDSHGFTAPKFGSAGSGGAENEPLPRGVRD